MNVVLQSKERTLLSVSSEELVGLCNALNEICNDRNFAENEFQTRLGVTREFLAGLLAQMPAQASVVSDTTERVDVWSANGAVHMLCVSSFGDPVELSGKEANEFTNRLQSAIKDTE